MEKYKCESCDDSFRTDLQLRKHFGMAHPAVMLVIVEEEPPKIRPVLNIWSGETVDWDISEDKPRKMKPDELCSTCGSRAYIIEHGQPQCYGSWTTWGCHYSEDEIETDRKWWKIPCRKRSTYVSKNLSKKERRKIVKTVAGLEREVWAEMSLTPLKDLEKWHDDKLRTEVRMLEYVRSTSC